MSRVLIVEDEALIAMMLEDFLDAAGHEVHATCSELSAALEEIEKGGFDVAILDVNLRGETSWPAADALSAKNIPFLLATGGHVAPPPSQYMNQPTLSKPFTEDRIAPAIEAALASVS